MRRMGRDGSPTTRAGRVLWRGALALLGAGVLASGSLRLGASNDQLGSRAGDRRSGEAELVTFQAADAPGLSRLLEAAWEGVGPLQVPGLAPVALPQDLDSLSSEDRKQVFVRSLLPHVLQVNERVRRERAALIAAKRRWEEDRTLSEVETTWLLGVARRYRRGADAAENLRENPGAFLTDLLRRVDVVPPSLALAQAAIESAWGASRFSREGNALFGQWVFSRHGGMAPRDRPEGSAYSVARFDTMGLAVEAYLKNLNTLWAYREFRQLRAGMRADGAALDSLELARGLLLYSERREEYIEDVRRVIRGNRMTRFDRARLAALDPERAESLLNEPGLLTRRAGGEVESKPDA